jgi:hypothetical protein
MIHLNPEKRNYIDRVRLVVIMHLFLARFIRCVNRELAK